MSFELLNNVYAETGCREATREIVTGILNGNYDVTTSDYNWRAIEEEMINDVLIEELAADEYVLGCANPNFLSEVTGIDSDVFVAMHEAEAFDAIGKLIISGGFVTRYAERLLAWDGPGPHFAHYDGAERMVDFWVEKRKRREYVYIFKTN